MVERKEKAEESTSPFNSREVLSFFRKTLEPTKAVRFLALFL
jgi:hypothetical protein